MSKKAEKLNSLGTGFWVFLSVILIVLAAVGLTLYTNYQAEIRHKESQEAAKLEQGRREADEFRNKWINDTERTACITNAQEQFAEGWEKDVAFLGRSDNRLPKEYSQVHEDRLDKAKQECYQQFGYS